jgi:3-hydroxyisobutyrate dehydrogenase
VRPAEINKARKGPVRTIAFIGLGRMGSLMAPLLARAGFAVQSHDRTGAGTHRSARAAARGADLLITMLPDGRAVRQAVRAALPELRPGAIVVDMSSSDPAGTRRLGAELAARGIAMLDAPVSGAVGKARNGTLAIMVGGEAATLKRARPALERLGSEIFHTGGLGSGHAVKALNNYLGAAGTIAGFEALLIGEAFGLDPRVLVDVINASTGRNSTTERKIPQQVFTGAFASGFKLALMAKDVGIAAGIARERGIEAPYLRQTLKIWRAAGRRLRAGADHTEMLHFLEQLTPAPRRPRAVHHRPRGTRV